MPSVLKKKIRYVPLTHLKTISALLIHQLIVISCKKNLYIYVSMMITGSDIMYGIAKGRGERTEEGAKGKNRGEL